MCFNEEEKKGGKKEMKRIRKDCSETDWVIDALRFSNHHRQIIIDDLIMESVEKDNKIKELYECIDNLRKEFWRSKGK